MPTANANIGNGFSKAVSYIRQEQKKDLPDHEKAVLMEQNNVFGNSRDIGKQMREVSDERPNVKKPVLHVQINFHPDEKLSQEQAQKAIDSILKDIGVEKDNHQYVLVKHNDKAHEHYHAVINRVGMDASLLDTHRIKDRLQVACDKVEKEQNLRPTQNRTVKYDPSQEKGYSYISQEEKNKIRQQAREERQKGKKEIQDKNPKIKEVKNNLEKDIAQVLSKEEIQHPEKLKEKLQEKGIDVDFKTNKNGIYGVSFRRDDIAVKGSDVGFKWGELKNAMEENKERSKAIENAIPHRTESTLSADMEKKLSLYVYENPKKDKNSIGLSDNAIRDVMREKDPKTNPWLTWERESKDDPKAYKWLEKEAQKSISQSKEIKIETKVEQGEGRPEPTAKEKEEKMYTEEYNRAINKSVNEFKAEIESGNIEPETDKIFEKNGFDQDQQNYIFNRGSQSIKVSKERFRAVQKDAVRQYNIYDKRREEYEKTAKERPKEIGVFDRISGKAKEKEAYNENLEQRQIRNQKPEFKPQVHGLNGSDFEVRASIDMKMAQWEQRKSAEQAQTKAEERAKEQDRGRGMGRGR